MAGHRAPGLSGGRCEGAHAGPALAGAVGEADEVLQRPVQVTADGAVQVEGDGDKGKHGASGVRSTRPEAADFGHTLPVHAKGLAKIGEVEEARSCKPSEFPATSAGYADPPSEAGFAFQGFGIAASRKSGPHADHSARPASLHQYPAQSNRAGYPLVRKGILHLDDIASSMAFSESEQSKNRASEMVPLYAARVQDLGPDDMAVFKLEPAAISRSYGRAF